MRRFLTLIASYFVFAFSSNVTAQIISDESLPNNSVVSDELEITGGTRSGNNLFHSFQEFSLSTGETAFFNHDLAIENIINRVTGSSVSTIDGLIRSLGDANLFLINPNGIIFGENAALDVGGSFIGSTANSIQFADGSEFSAIASNNEPLLTVSIPIGLQYGNNPGDITVAGAGNNLSIDLATLFVDRSDRPTGLAVSSGNTLALIGGDVFLPGGNITAGDGKVVIGSVGDSGLVTLTPSELGWDFDYDLVNTFGAINLSQAASVEVSGNGGGAVSFQGRSISLTDGSAVLADTLGDSSGRSLEISATESVELIGSSTEKIFPTRLSTNVDFNATGNGGNLSINTDRLLVAEDAQVNSGVFGLGNGGNLTVTANEIEVIGLGSSELGTGLFAQPDFGNTGKGGDLTINTNSLLITEGAQISTTTFGSGDGGNVTVNASSIELIGAGEFDSSGLLALTRGEGQGGNIEITADSLSIERGAQIATTTFDFGDGGNLIVNASSIELIGVGEFANSRLLALTGGEGQGGNIEITTDSLLVAEGAQIGTATNSSQNAGNLDVKAREIELSGGSRFGPSSLFASVRFTEIREEAEDGTPILNFIEASGNGGNINVESSKLSIAGGAQIVASTNTLGNAGTIAIDSQTITITGTSPSGNTPSGIVANTLESEGSGGNIAISTVNLNLTEGAQISTSTSGFGNGGDLRVVASDTIRLSGTSDSGSSGLFASAIFNNGSGGNITVETNLLSLIDGATISVSNFPSSINSPFPPGEGAAGNATIVAKETILDERAIITAETFTGDRGNLNLQTDLLLLRRGSSISTNAQGTATGGNINIDASQGFLVAIPQENSDITANAVFGDGGRVNIAALEILGIQPRRNLTSFSDITASSEFGIAGNVILNTQDLNPTAELDELPNALKPQELAQGCQVTEEGDNSSFVSLGQGGLNPQPSDSLGSDELMGDVRLPQQWSNSATNNGIVEAQSLVIGEKGQLALVANNPTKLHCQD